MAVLFFFHNKISQAQNRVQQRKIKKYAQKRKKVTYSLICILCFCTFSAFSKIKESILFLTSPTKLDFICIVLI